MGCGRPVMMLVTTLPLLLPSSARSDDSPLTPQYRRHLCAVLEAGFDSKSTDLASAERHFRSAESERPGDPRAAYAYGQVLLHNHKHSDGFELIQQAATAQPVYLPALQAVIRESIRRRQYSEAIKGLIILSKALGGAHVDPQAAEVVAVTRWTGVAMAFLSGPLKLGSVAEEAQVANGSILHNLPAALHPHFEQGMLDTKAIVGQFVIEQQAADKLAEAKQQADEDEAVERMAELKSRQDELLEAKNREDATTAETVSDLETSLEQAIDKYETLNKSASSLLSSIQLTQLEINRLKQQADDPDLGRTRATQLNIDILIHSRQLDLYTSEYSKVVEDRATTARQGKALMARWRATNAQARRTDQVISARMKKFDQWNQQLARSIQGQKQSSTRTRRMRSIENRKRSFSTYDSFDPEKESQRLLTEWKATPP